MSNADGELLNLIQKNFPVHIRPYQKIGEELGISEQEVMERIKKLKEDGDIRRIGATMNTRQIGYISTLCALSVPEKELSRVGEFISGFPEVTHNYIRTHHYNLWFTLTAPSKEHLEQVLSQIENTADCGAILNLPTEQMFKINVEFQF